MRVKLTLVVTPNAVGAQTKERRNVSAVSMKSQ